MSLRHILKTLITDILVPDQVSVSLAVDGRTICGNTKIAPGETPSQAIERLETEIRSAAGFPSLLEERQEKILTELDRLYQKRIDSIDQASTYREQAETSSVEARTRLQSLAELEDARNAKIWGQIEIIEAQPATVEARNALNRPRPE